NVLFDSIEFLHKEAEYRCIEVDVDVEEDLKIETDRGKLQQIFLNLINNAFAAMSDSGRLDIIARGEGEHVSIEVADNGSGISKKDLKHIFEPFYSTKKEKGGTGLGLSITYGLVQELNGELRVRSRLGQGTTFNITLPKKREA
ncbi:MAG: HAMP domain-containing histidine kinase, partial [bacterium]|nr:HAMP domain-containing histidine kinase [bacterium]